MADPLTGAIEWFNPHPRAIFPLDAFHVPASLTWSVPLGLPMPMNSSNKWSMVTILSSVSVVCG